MIRRPRRIALAVTAIFSLTAAGALWVWVDAQPSIVKAGKARVYVDKRYFMPGGSAGVAVGGQLGLTNGECVTLTWPDGPGPALLIWPRSTTIAGADEALSFTLNGETARLGDTIEIGVSEPTPSWVQNRFDDQVPSACASLNPYLIDSLDTVTRN